MTVVRLSTATAEVGRGDPPVLTGDDLSGPVASAGKVPLLAAVADQVVRGGLALDAVVDVEPDDVTGGTGVLDALGSRRWTVQDLAVLAAGVSDNTATNALLRLVGLEHVNALVGRLGLEDLRVLDRVRSERGAGDPPAFAVGTAADLCEVAAALADRSWPSADAADLTTGWMRGNQDRSFVPRAIGDRVDVVDKTGTDAGVLVDVGWMPSARLAFAVVARWEDGPAGDDPTAAAVGAIAAHARTLAARLRR